MNTHKIVGAVVEVLLLISMVGLNSILGITIFEWFEDRVKQSKQGKQSKPEENDK